MPEYPPEVITKAEEIFYAIKPGWPKHLPRLQFHEWFNTPTAPTQSHFAKLAVMALEAEKKQT